MATILVKKGAGVPSPDSLQEAELGLDTTNGSLYTKLANGSIVHLNDGADDVDLSDYVTEAPIDTKQYVRQDGDWAEIVIPDGGTGAGMVISDSEPADPVEGMQWLNPTNGLVLFWDGAKWLEMPGAVDGVDGRNGTDGTGFTGGSYDANTGIVTFTSDDGLGFVTDDLRGTNGTNGKGFTGGSYDAGTGVVTFTSDDGLGFDTGDLRGADGAPGDGIDVDGNLTVNRITLGSWSFAVSGDELTFTVGGNVVAKVTSDGKIIGKDDITAFGI